MSLSKFISPNAYDLYDVVDDVIPSQISWIKWLDCKYLAIVWLFVTRHLKDNDFISANIWKS